MFSKPGEGSTPVDPVVIHPETIGEVKGVVEVASPDVFGSGVGVTLPLYDPESFPEADRVKIPAESTFIDHDDLNISHPLRQSTSQGTHYISFLVVKRNNHRKERHPITFHQHRLDARITQSRSQIVEQVQSSMHDVPNLAEPVQFSGQHKTPN